MVPSVPHRQTAHTACVLCGVQKNSHGRLVRCELDILCDPRVRRHKMAAKRSTTRFLSALREHLKSKKYHRDVISAYIIPTSDAHQVCAYSVLESCVYGAKPRTQYADSLVAALLAYPHTDSDTHTCMNTHAQGSFIMHHSIPSSRTAQWLTVPARCWLMRCTCVTLGHSTGMAAPMSPGPCILAHLRTFRRCIHEL